MQRLNDSRFGTGDVADIKRYIKLGPLGRVFAAEERHVLLIDEVDKADLEFPNDLLRELDEMRFSITETGEEIVAGHRPVVIITSNNEKELPDAFLRRCIFYYIEFPDPALMRKIIAVHHPHLDAKLLDQVLIKFYWLREQGELRKKPSTSELIDWISALLRSGISMEKIGDAHPLHRRPAQDRAGCRRARPLRPEGRPVPGEVGRPGAAVQSVRGGLLVVGLLVAEALTRPPQNHQRKLRN